LAPNLRKKNPVKRGLLWIIAVYMLGCGCLIAPDITEDPGEINYPPEIVLDSVEPADTGGTIILDRNPECSPMVFEIMNVRDLNIKDKLYRDWFLDWNPTIKNDGAWITTNPSGNESRSVKAVELPLDLLDDDKAYTLRVFVADRSPEMIEGGLGFTFLEGEEDGKFDYYQWTIKLSVNEGEGVCSSD